MRVFFLFRLIAVLGFKISDNKNFPFKRLLNLNFVLFLSIYSLTLREERRLRVFENRLLRRIFGPKRDVVIKEWRKLYNEELSLDY